VVHRLPQVVQERGRLGHIDVGPELGGDHPRQLGRLDGVGQLVLAERRPEPQTP
jgi:hypothetical protein